MCYRHVGKPVPGRHAHLFGQGQQTVGSTAAVTSDNDQLLSDDLDDKLFPASADGGDIDLTGFYQTVNIFVVP